MAAWPGPSIAPSRSQDSTTSYSSITSRSPPSGNGRRSPASRLLNSKNSKSSKKSKKKAGGTSSLSPKGLNNKQKESTILAVLRVIVLATFLIYQLMCVLQSQHVIIHDDGLSQTHMINGGGGGDIDVDMNMGGGGVHPATYRREWRVPTRRGGGQVPSDSGSSSSLKVVSGGGSVSASLRGALAAPPASNSFAEGKISDTTASGSFNEGIFQMKLNQWRRKTDRLVQHQSLQKLQRQQQQKQAEMMHNKASATSRLLRDNNTTKPPQPDRQQLYIPFWDQQAMYRKRHSWHLMTVIMADDCLHNYRKTKRLTTYPTLVTLQDAIQRSNWTDIIIYFPQTPKSTLFEAASELSRQDQQACQATLQSYIKKRYQTNLEMGQLQVIEGIINPLPPRIAYEYHHHYPAALKQMEKSFNLLSLGDRLEAIRKLKHKLQSQQLQIEIDYSLGLDFAYVAELVYEYHGDLLLFLRAGTTFIDYQQQQQQDPPTNEDYNDYAARIISQYENFQQRLDRDMLIHRFCYMSFLKEDGWIQLPTGNKTLDKNLPPRFQKSLGAVPTAIVLERHNLYRLSMVMRSLLPYRRFSTTDVLMVYCDELLWESQVLQPVSDALLQNETAHIVESDFLPPLFHVEERTDNITQANQAAAAATALLPLDKTDSESVQKELTRIQQQQDTNTKENLMIPAWVTVDNRQLGPQRTVNPADLLQLPAKFRNNNTQNTLWDRKLVTFVVPSATRPNGIKNEYVTRSLNQLFPLIRRDFKEPKTGKLQANVLLVICGNTQDELDDHQDGLWEYYGPEIKEGILEIVSTNLETYPSLHNIPNNYNDPENRLRWRSKQNLDISSSLFAAKGKSDYIMLLEDDTGYRDKFTPTLKTLLESDKRQEKLLEPNPEISGFGPFADDYRQHIFSQVHFGFGYSGVLIHDDDALVYATLHYVLMDEKPCDLLFLASFLQGQVLDQKWRWQLKRVLLTHLGSVSSLKGKTQPVWGVKG